MDYPAALDLNEILPQIRANRPTTEMLGRVPDENVSLLRQAGFFKALQPRAFGGLELDHDEYAPLIAQIAQACPSTAWACGLLANHSHSIALFDERLQQEIWGENPDVLVSSSVAPLGKWQAVDGGIRLSGQFGWSSGSDHADWAVLGFMGTNNMGQPGPCFAVVPRCDYEILDDWNSNALKGTGSKSLLVKDVFVPDYRIESLFALNYGLTRGYKSHPGYIFYTPFSPIFSIGFSAVALGIAKRTVELYQEKTKSRQRAYTGSKVAESAPAYMRLAESVNQIHAAECLLTNDWRNMRDTAMQKVLPTPEESLQWRANQSYAIKILIEAVDRLFMASGGSAWSADNEMQQLFRDVHIAGTHAQTDYDVAAQTYGRHLMGMEPNAANY